MALLYTDLLEGKHPKNKELNTILNTLNMYTHLSCFPYLVQYKDRTKMEEAVDHIVAGVQGLKDYYERIRIATITLITNVIDSRLKDNPKQRQVEYEYLQNEETFKREILSRCEGTLKAIRDVLEQERSSVKPEEEDQKQLIQEQDTMQYHLQNTRDHILYYLQMNEEPKDRPVSIYPMDYLFMMYACVVLKHPYRLGDTRITNPSVISFIESYRLFRQVIDKYTPNHAITP